MPGTFSAAAPVSNPQHQAAPRPSRGPSMSGPRNRYCCQKLRQAVIRAVRSSSPASRLSSNDGELKRSAHHRCCLRRCLRPVLAGARAGHDDLRPGPLPHQTYAALVGGPLDGLLLDISGWCPEVIDDGAALVTELGRWPGGRSLYDPCPGEPRSSGHGCGVAAPAHTRTPQAGPKAAAGPAAEVRTSRSLAPSG
ncbi:hypothetical protein SGPA1_40677 [Streptomyces misionensis JCM 4497]